MKKLTHRWTRTALTTIIVLLISGLLATADTRGLSVQVKSGESPDAEVVDTVTLYNASYALVIGIDDYQNGWPRLSNAVADAEQVAGELENHGFAVTLRKNLKSAELDRELKEFFILKGEDPDSQLLVWFAGHGATLSGEGFLVPADAPPPEAGANFMLNALSMRRFGEYVRLARSKHALAIFDACFAGTIFTSQRSKPPAAITMATTYPVRQFLTSGDEKQEVSDNGTFRKLFIRALRGEERADLNDDGYLTGSELGMFLDNRMTNLTNARQTPRYGKLRDEDYDRGDFVFQAFTPEVTGSVSTETPKQKEEDTGTLTVTSLPPGAAVYLDGQGQGTTPANMKGMQPGRHRIRVEQTGYLPEEREVEVEAGKSVEESFVMTANEQKGRLFVRTQPADAVVQILNLTDRSQSGMKGNESRYQVEVTKEGYVTDTRTLTLTGDEILDLEIVLKRK